MIFENFPLDKLIHKALAKLDYITPTPIQQQAIPVALEGSDILASADTGTGKTLAFVLPMLQHVITQPQSGALVLLPTRELATQVLGVIEGLVGKDKLKTALLIGGADMHKQLLQLKRSPRIIIATPGRMNDHLERKTVKLEHFNFLVLDETDRMLDMGFEVQLETIIPKLNFKRQTLMFSATLPKNIIKISERYLNQPVKIAVATQKTKPNIVETFMVLKEDHKYNQLTQELGEREGSVIIFAKTKGKVERIAEQLADDGFEVDYIHGDLRQRQRDRVIKQFREGRYRVIVATDIAARGIDIPHIEHVINYDLPQLAEDYVHRIGRTGRAGKKGFSVCFITNADARHWKEMSKYTTNSETVEGLFVKKTSSSKDSGGSRGRKESGRFQSDRGFGGKGKFGGERGESRKPRFGAEKAEGRKPRFKDSTDFPKRSFKPSEEASDSPRPARADKFKRPYEDDSAPAFKRRAPKTNDELDSRRSKSDNQFLFNELDAPKRKRGGGKDFASDEAPRARKSFGDSTPFGQESRKRTSSGEGRKFSGEGKRFGGEGKKFSGEGRKFGGEGKRFGGASSSGGPRKASFKR